MSYPRFMLRVLLILSAALSGLLHAGDPLAGFRFIDGRAHTLAEAGPYGVLIVRFCGVCPTAAEFMRSKCKTLYEAIESEHLPVQLVCATPDHDDLGGWAKELGYTWAWVAQDVANPLNIGTSNIYQLRLHVKGREVYIDFADPLGNMRKSLKDCALRYPVDGLDGKSADLWWQIERGRPDALGLLARAATSPLKADAAKIRAAVVPALQNRLKAGVEAGDTIDAFDLLDALAAECGAKSPIDLKPAKDRMTALRKLPALKDEFTARDAWTRCQVLLAGKDRERKDGQAGLAQIAARFPATKYGKLSAP